MAPQKRSHKRQGTTEPITAAVEGTPTRRKRGPNRPKVRDEEEPGDFTWTGKRLALLFLFGVILGAFLFRPRRAPAGPSLVLDTFKKNIELARGDIADVKSDADALERRVRKLEDREPMPAERPRVPVTEK